MVEAARARAIHRIEEGTQKKRKEEQAKKIR